MPQARSVLFSLSLLAMLIGTPSLAELDIREVRHFVETEREMIKSHTAETLQRTRETARRAPKELDRQIQALLSRKILEDYKQGILDSELLQAFAGTPEGWTYFSQLKFEAYVKVWKKVEIANSLAYADKRTYDGKFSRFLENMLSAWHKTNPSTADGFSKFCLLASYLGDVSDFDPHTLQRAASALVAGHRVSRIHGWRNIEDYFAFFMEEVFPTQKRTFQQNLESMDRVLLHPERLEQLLVDLETARQEAMPVQRRAFVTKVKDLCAGWYKKLSALNPLK